MIFLSRWNSKVKLRLKDGSMSKFFVSGQPGLHILVDEPETSSWKKKPKQKAKTKREEGRDWLFRLFIQVLGLSQWQKPDSIIYSPDQLYKNSWQKSQVSVYFCWGTNTFHSSTFYKYTGAPPTQTSIGCCPGLQFVHSFAKGSLRAKPFTSPSLCTWTLLHLQNERTFHFFPTVVLIMCFTNNRTCILSSGLISWTMHLFSRVLQLRGHSHVWFLQARSIDHYF